MRPCAAVQMVINRSTHSHIRRSLRNLAGLLSLTAALFFFSPAAQAQGTIRYPYDNSMTNRSGQLPGLGLPQYDENGQLIDPNAPPEQDTVPKKPRKPRKPLESFYFDDSTRQNPIFSWSVNLETNDVTLHDVDTLLSGYEVDYPFLKQDIGSASLGNLGGATIPLRYIDRPQIINFEFVKAWRAYQKRPEDIRFYNARMPYTNISYEMSGQRAFEESLFHIILSQNISPSTSVNIDYHADGTKGSYTNQKAMDKNFSANFAHTGKRYAIHAGYIYNTGNINENGGVQNPADVRDTLFKQANNIPVNLTKANNLYKGNTFYLTQSYAQPLRRQKQSELTISEIPSIFFGNSIEYTTYKKTYTDTTSTFYDNYYIDPLNTRDSVHEALADIRFFVRVQPYSRTGVLGIVTGGVGAELNNYHIDIPAAYAGAYNFGGKTSDNSYFLYGNATGAVSRYVHWEADGQFYFAGHHMGDFELGGQLSLSAYIRQQPLTLTGAIRITNETPEFWQENYFSNHYAWQLDLSREQSTTFSASLTMPSRGLELGANYQVVNNRVYYGPNVVPLQYGSALNMLDIYLRKDFKLGIFRLNHRILMQWSSNQEVAPAPLLSAYLSYYLDIPVVRDVLQIQLGVDCRYNTEYYAYAYDPALGQFYTQQNEKLGNYPYLDAFVSAKWKRARFMIKGQHWNQNLFGDNNYFQVVNYPQNRTMLKFAISWSFYD